MPSKYCHTQGTNSNYVDLTSICELQVHDAVPGFGETETTGTNFVGESFQKAGTNTQNIVLSGYNVNGSGTTFVKKGCYPTFSKSIWASTTPGRYQITRTDTSLTIGSSTFYATDFRCNSIPHELIILTVGAGGGGGGNGYFSPGKDKSGFVKISGGAGGGGAQAIGRLKISNDYTYYVAVGTGGAAGSDGSSGAKSTGTAGGVGGSSYVAYYNGGYTLLWGASGGYGGTAGAGGDNTGTAGTGGVGGTANIIADYNPGNLHYLNTNYCSGGKGNYYQSHNNTESAGLTFLPTSGTGATEVTVSNSRSNNASTENKDDGSNSYFSGGCSYGFGGYFSNGTASAGGTGGGGTAGITVSPGNSGKVEIWY